MRTTVSVDVDVDIEDVLDQLSDEDLSAIGLLRCASKGRGLPATEWHEVRQAMRQRDARRLNDILADMAWNQAGVILPSGTPLIH